MNDQTLFMVLSEVVGLYSAPKHNYKATVTVNGHGGLVLPAGAFDVELHLTHLPSNIAVSRGFGMDEILRLLGDSADATGGQMIEFLDNTYKVMYADLDKAVLAQKRKQQQAEAHHGTAENPDLIQHVVAFRAWGGWTGKALGSTGIGAEWLPGVNHAHCLRARFSFYAGTNHPAPDPDCGCGLYGVFDIHTARQMGHIIGAVKYWGRMEVHRNGLRAEYAEIVALGGGANKDMAELFKVPLVHDELLAAEAKKHGIEMPEELKPDPEPAPQNPFSGGLSVAATQYQPITWQPVPVPTRASVPKRVRSWPYRLLVWAVVGSGIAGLLMGVTNGILR